MGTGIALPGTTSSHTPGTPSPTHPCYMAPPRTRHGVLYMVVGLISVDQLSLGLQISGFQGMTEVYNLIKVGRINNH